ncbi:MAG: histidine kinase [Bacteroidota bacterium]
MTFCLKCKQFYILTFLFFFTTRYVYAQNYNVRNFTAADGLPTNSTRKIFKDSRGYIWIGTDAGVARFDGKTFNVFNSLDGLAGDEVWGITEDKNGNMFFACYDGGVTKYDGSKFLNYTPKNGLVGKSARVVQYSPQFDLVFVATESGFSIIKDDKIKSFSAESIYRKPRVYFTGMIEANGYLYIYSHGDSMITYCPQINKIKVLNCNSHLFTMAASSSIVRSNGDTLLGFERSGFSAYSKKRTDYDNIGQIFDFSEDKQRNIWIAGWSCSFMKEPGGLFKFDGEKVWQMNNVLGIETRTMFSVFCDRQTNSIWAASDNMGVYQITPSIFLYYKSDFFNSDKIKVIDLLFLNHNLWIVSPTCIYVMDKDKKLFAYQKALFEKVYSKSKIKAVNRKLVCFTHVTSDNQNNIWITSDIGLFRITHESQKIKYFPIENNGGLCQTQFDKNNILYFGGWGYLSIVENVDNICFKKIDENPKNIPCDILKIAINKNEVWIGSSNRGIYRIKNNIIYSSHKRQPDLIKNVSEIYIDKNDDIIFGGTNGTVYIACFIADSLQVRCKISRKEGLNGQAISWIKTSNNDEFLWIATNTGLNRLNLKKLLKKHEFKFNFYNKSEGLESLNVGCSAIDDDGNLWAGSNIGLVKINTHENEVPISVQPKIILASFEVNNKPIRHLYPNDINSWNQMPTTPIVLEHDQNNLILTVGILNYVNPEKDIFRYKLKGLDNQWTTFDKSRKISYTNLYPGEYTLCVESKNLSSGQFANPLHLKFYIKKPFWATWWFLVSMFSIAISSIFYIIRYRTQRIIKQEQLKTTIAKTIAEYEMKALQAQMNPHFIFNAMNSIQNYILEQDTDQALSYLSDFAKIIRLTLDQASKKLISLSDEIEYLSNYLKLEQMRFKDKFEITININGLDKDAILLPPMMIQPFVENAIKHGLTPCNYKGKLNINFLSTTENLICTIEDNGIGINKSIELNKNNPNFYKSQGTSITANRLALVETNKNITCKIEIYDLAQINTNCTGTKIIVVLPLVIDE